MSTFMPDHTAFPSAEDQTEGMHMRQWFAGQALAGYLAAFAGDDIPLPAPEDAARAAFEYADAMLAESAKPKK
jgi:hypothetical protein